MEISGFNIVHITMELFNTNYSMKNTPTPSQESYKLLLIDEIESVIKRMSWKAYFFMENKVKNIKNLVKKLLDSTQNTIQVNLNI